jgi:hypothetical protein
MDTLIKEKANRVDIAETSLLGKSFIQFDFVGYLDHPSAVSGVDHWKMIMMGSEKKDLIFNCTNMTGFDTTSRQMWQATMKELKQKIGHIWIISTNQFILAAAKTMGLLSGFSIKTARSIDQIKI